MRTKHWLLAPLLALAACTAQPGQNPFAALATGGFAYPGYSEYDGAPTYLDDGVQVPLVIIDNQWGYYDRGRRWHRAPDQLHRHLAARYAADTRFRSAVQRPPVPHGAIPAAASQRAVAAPAAAPHGFPGPTTRPGAPGPLPQHAAPGPLPHHAAPGPLPQHAGPAPQHAMPVAAPRPIAPAPQHAAPVAAPRPIAPAPQHAAPPPVPHSAPAPQPHSCPRPGQRC
jgi:hypothetical protein